MTRETEKWVSMRRKLPIQISSMVEKWKFSVFVVRQGCFHVCIHCEVGKILGSDIAESQTLVPGGKKCNMRRRMGTWWLTLRCISPVSLHREKHTPKKKKNTCPKNKASPSFSFFFKHCITFLFRLLSNSWTQILPYQFPECCGPRHVSWYLAH